MWSTAINNWKAAQKTAKATMPTRRREWTQAGRDLGARLQHDARADDGRDAAAGADDGDLWVGETSRRRAPARQAQGTAAKYSQPWRALLDAVAKRSEEVDVAEQVEPTGVREAGLQRRPHARMFRTVGEARD